LASFPQNEGTDNPYRPKMFPAIHNDLEQIHYDSDTELGKDGSATIYLTDYHYASSTGRIISELYPMFSTGVKHKDITMWDFFLVLIGIVGGGIFGCIAGIVAPLILSHFFGTGGTP